MGCLGQLFTCRLNCIHIIGFESFFEFLDAIFNLSRARFNLIDAYTQVLDIDETEIEALNALEGLYNLVGDWDSLVTVLGQKADQSADWLLS